MEGGYCQCCDDTIIFFKRHSAKIAMVLGVLGIISSVLLSLEYIKVSGVIMGLTNFIILLGSIVYERLGCRYQFLQEENEKLQLENRRLTVYKFPVEVARAPDEFNGLYMDS